MIDIPIVIFLSFIISTISLPKAIKKLSEKGITVKDVYKIDSPQIPNQGAMVILFVSFLVCGSYPLINRLLSRIFISYDFHDFTVIDLSILFVISIFAFYGFLDDMFDFSWRLKIVLPFFFTFPLLPYIDNISLDLPRGEVLDLENYDFLGIKVTHLFKLLLIPIYVMVVSNLTNMHSGFNGLQSGVSLIVMVTILVKLLLISSYESVLVISSFIGGVFSFWIFNKYPSKIFEGNIGSQTTGALIGSILIINNLYFFGILILLIHIFDFLLFAYERLIVKNTFTKFGVVDDSGFIQSPTPYKVKFLIPYYFKIDEKKVVLVNYSMTLICCLLALVIF